MSLQKMGRPAAGTPRAQHLEQSRDASFVVSARTVVVSVASNSFQPPARRSAARMRASADVLLAPGRRGALERPGARRCGALARS